MPDIFRNTDKQVFTEGEQPDNLIPYETEGEVFIEGEGDALVVERDILEQGIEVEGKEGTIEREILSGGIHTDTDDVPLVTDRNLFDNGIEVECECD